MVENIKNFLMQNNKYYFHLLNYFISIALGMIFTLSLLWILVWILPKEIFGTLVLLKSTILIACSLLSLGVSQSVTRFSNNHNEDKDLINNTLIIVFLGSIFSAIITLILIKIFNQSFKIVINLELGLLILLSSLFYMINNESINWFRAKQKSSNYLKLHIIRTSINFFLISLFVYLFHTIESYLYGFLLSELFISFLSLIAIKVDKSFDKELLFKMLVYGWPHAIVISCSYIITYADRYMLSIYYGSNSIVATYEVAYVIVTGIMGLIIRPYNLMLFPLYTDIFEKQGAIQTVTRIQKIQKNYIFVSTFACVFLIILAPIIINILFPENYKVDLYVFSFLGLSLILTGQIMANSAGINLKNKTILLIIPSLSAIVANILLNIILIPLYAMIGAAIATMLSVAIQLLFINFISKKYLNVDFPLLSIFTSFILIIFITYLIN